MFLFIYYYLLTKFKLCPNVEEKKKSPEDGAIQMVKISGNAIDIVNAKRRLVYLELVDLEKYFIDRDSIVFAPSSSSFFFFFF